MTIVLLRADFIALTTAKERAKRPISSVGYPA
jgi:hypothetical protein